MSKVSKAQSVPTALLRPLRHPDNMLYTLWTKKSIKATAKTVKLAAAAFNMLSLTFKSVPALPQLKTTSTVIDMTSKLFVDSYRLARGFINRDIFKPGKDKNEPANTVGIDYKYQIPYVVKIVALTVATLATAYIAVKTCFVPQVAILGQAFTTYTAKIAFAIGGNNLASVANCLTSISLNTVRNVSLIVFLGISGYQCVNKVRAEMKRAKEEGRKVNWGEVVLQELKSVENLGKIAVITMCLFGAPTLMIVGTGLIVAYICVVTEYQNALPDKT